jgi:hypothetical protein
MSEQGEAIPNPLAGLIHKVISTGLKHQLSDSEALQFHTEFAYAYQALSAKLGAGAVPTDEQLIECWNQGGGKEYETLDGDKFARIPDDYFIECMRDILKLAAPQPAEVAGTPNALTVWFGSMPEPNGKKNWTAILHKGDITEGFTIARSEYQDRVIYAADCVKYLIGEIEVEPSIMDYYGELQTPPQPTGNHFDAVSQRGVAGEVGIEVSCKCGLHKIPAWANGVSWYWQLHKRDVCMLELPNIRCWCGLLRSEHLEGHADTNAPKAPEAVPLSDEKIRALWLDHCVATKFVGASIVNFAREIESAHGITRDKQ